MKKKIIFIMLCLVCIGSFFGIVHHIEKEQQKVKKMEEISLESLQAGSTEGESLPEIMSREDFGEIIEVSVGMEGSVVGKDLGEAAYKYDTQEKIAEFKEILEKYEYYPTDMSDSMMERLVEFSGIELRGSSEIIFNVRFSKIPDVDDVMFAYMWADDLGGAMTNGMSDRWYNVYRLVDWKLAEELIAWLEVNTPLMSLELAEAKIEQAKATQERMARAVFFGNRIDTFEEHMDMENSDIYTMYIQPLSDYEGYLKIYVFSAGWSREDDIDCLRYIFKIELYNEDGTFVRELYNDVETYDKDRLEHL